MKTHKNLEDQDASQEDIVWTTKVSLDKGRKVKDVLGNQDPLKKFHKD
jgi:hypothetical protein